MRHFGVSSDLALSATASTNTYPVGLISGTGRSFVIYQLFAGANQATVVSGQVIVEVNGTSGALTPGSAITPTDIDSGNSSPASITAASSAPTGMTLSPTNPYLRLAFNAMQAWAWTPPDPDSGIVFPAGGGAAGSALLTNRTPVTSSGITLSNQVFFKE
jgi:hypothetical protein